VGVQGPEFAIGRATALRLATVAGAELDGDGSRLGPLASGRFADLVAFRHDPMTCDVDRLPQLKPALTIVDGETVFDPEGILTAANNGRGGRQTVKLRPPVSDR